MFCPKVCIIQGGSISSSKYANKELGVFERL